MISSKTLGFVKVSVLFLGIVFLSTCSSPHRNSMSKEMCLGSNANLVDEIRSRGKLVATTNYSSTNYFVYRGEPMGYQYELLKSFADFLGVKLEIVVKNEIEAAFDVLNNGECDLIALDLAITKDRKRMADFSNPLSQTRQVLVQRRPENWRKLGTWDEMESRLIRNQVDLAGKTIYIQKNSSLAERLHSLQQEIGDTIFVVEDPERTSEDLIRMVANGEIDYTVADEHIALVNQNYYSDIDVNTPVSFPQNIGWAVRKGSDELLVSINTWLEENKRSRKNLLVYNKYFTNPRSARLIQSEFNSVKGGKISEYDDILKEQSKLLDWDWRLLASLIFEESTFNPDVRSWAGAFGLMQLMPLTMEQFGIDSLASPRENIEAGVRFLKWLDDQFAGTVEDDQERQKFVLAAYNVGIAHVFDAMRLAEKYGKDPSKWKDNVDYFVLNKSNPKFYTDAVVLYGYARGEEPFKFVGDILERYDHYRNVVN
jgi:membrane-bound lytic murein transglycosylase F